MRNWRINFLLIIFIIMAATITSRLFFLQVKNYGFYAALARGQHQFVEAVAPKRGEIFAQDKDGRLQALAKNKEWKIIYAVPSELKNAQEPARKISEIINMPEDEISRKLNDKSTSYKIIAKQIDIATVSKIEDLKLDGIYASDDPGRLYPSGNFASHITGFVGYRDDQKVGQYGLEGHYNDLLSGKSGSVVGEKDALGNLIAIAKKSIAPVKDGDDLILTIDQNIQYQAEKILGEFFQKLKAEEGTIIVMDPSSGAIKAIANLPGYNPNEYTGESDINVFLNPAIQKIFEPGSIVKPFTMAAALDAGKISPDTIYDDGGEVKIGGYTIRNFDGRGRGTQTMTQVLEQSLNTGAVFAQRQLGNELFRKYIEDFGFAKKTGIDLAGEESGDIKNLYQNYEVNFATASFGQGIAVTPMQLVAAFSALANQGKMMQPHIVDSFRYPDGSSEKVAPREVGQVISSGAASKITAMLVSVIDNSYDKKAKVKGYFMAGKTGTAQVPLKDKRGYSDKTIHSFVGFAPAFKPKFLIFIKINNPQGINFAADSVTPAAQKLARYLLTYYEIPPERDE